MGVADALRAVRAFDAQAISAQRAEMGAAREKNHIMSSGGEFRAKIAAHRSRAHDRDAHALLLAATLDSGPGDVNFTAV
jgi:hypothetical protein